MFTNFSPRRHVNDFKGTYFVEKINIYQIKNSFVFTSKDPRIEEFISSAAHFSKLKNGLCKIVTISQVVTKFNVTKSRLHCISMFRREYE